MKPIGNGWVLICAIEVGGSVKLKLIYWRPALEKLSRILDFYPPVKNKKKPKGLFKMLCL